MKLNSAKLRLLSLLEEQMVFIVLVHYGILCNPYEHYQRPWGATRFKTSSPRICMLHFLPIRKDVALNTNCNLFLFYSWQLIDTELDCSSTQLDCASTICCSATSADLKTPEDIQLHLVALCQHRFVTVTMLLNSILCSFWGCILMHHFVLLFVRFKTLPVRLDITGIAGSDTPVHCCLLWLRPLLTFVQRKPAVTSVKQVLWHRYIICLLLPQHFFIFTFLSALFYFVCFCVFVVCFICVLFIFLC